MKRVCKSCNRTFTPYHTVPDQKYCRRKKCQRERQNHWRKNKIKTDQDYKENQYDSQKRWREKNKDYWRTYRSSHPAYTKRNKKMQKNRRLRQKDTLLKNGKLVAKSDELKPNDNRLSGYYQLVPAERKKVAKSDVLLVKIEFISGSYQLE